MAVFSAHILGEPFDVELKKTICKQPSYVSIFTNSHISTLSGLGGVSGTSDLVGKKKKKKKVPQLQLR